MPFLRDLKTITKASLKAVGDGVELLADVAEKAERSSSRLLLRSRIARMEQELEHQSENEVSTHELERIRDELESLYDELWKGATQPERAEIKRKRESTKLLIVKASISERERDIEKAKSWISQGLFQLPVQEINALNSLKRQQNHLADLFEGRSESGRAAVLRQEVKDIDTRVAALELKRNTVTTECYPNGSIKRRLEMRDGKLNGCAEGRYASGEREYQIAFRDGEFEGKAEHWRKNGSLVCDVRMQDNGQEHRLFLPGGQKIGSGKLSRTHGQLQFWLWDGYYLGQAKLANGRVHRFAFLFALFFKPGLWLRLFRASRGEPGLSGIRQMESTITAWNDFWLEMQNVRNS